MNRQQITLIASAVALFFILYFGCDVQSKEQKTFETARALTGATLDMATVIKEANKGLNPTQATEIQLLTQKSESAKDPSVLKQVSAAWHNVGHDEIAASYAEQVAEIEKTEESWEITTSFENFGAMQKKIEELGIEVENASLQRIALNTKSLPLTDAIKFLKMIEILEEDDDINTVYHNLELTDELIKELEK